MKNKLGKAMFTIAASLAAFSWRNARAEGIPAAPDGREWEDCSRLSLGKEAPRAFFFPFAPSEDAKRIFPVSPSARAVSLDSATEWRFKWAPDPASRPVGFQNPAYDVSGWDAVRVPCSWQAAGISPKCRFGTPLYTNVTYPFKRDKPRVTGVPPRDWTAFAARNPVGSYRRDFSVPAGWDASKFDIFLKFDAVDSFFYLWINGKYAGFSKDSRNPAEFNVTRLLKPGRNTVALEVYRYSDGSYLEDQDMFRLSGIARSVWLLARPKTRIRDFFAKPVPDDPADLSGGWTMQVTGDTAGAAPAGAKIRARLYKGAGFEIYERAGLKPPEAVLAAECTAIPAADGKFALSLPVRSPALWSAESPNCHTLVLDIENAGGAPGESVAAVTGFRVSEIKNRRFQVNNAKIKMRGANRHETHPLYGHFVPRSVQEQDIVQLKRANLNQVRNSHYPQDDYWYYLCNIYGIYLCDEANVESHGYGYGKESLSHDPAWRRATVDRAMAMVERNKNNPSIIIWSLGNEAGPGENFAASAAAVRARDRSRPIQYERDNSVADFDSNMYPSVEWVRRKAADWKSAKPFYIIEYAHCMLNAMGNLRDYQDAIESSDVIAGASIWDWVDQGLYAKDSAGRDIIAYGGDFGDKPNDGQFVMNGVMNADRSYKPAYMEAKRVFQPFAFKFGKFVKNDCGDTVPAVVVKNLNYFRDASYCDFYFRIMADGKTIASGTLPVGAIPPRGEVELVPGRTARFYEKSALSALPAGTVLSLRVHVIAARDEGLLPVPLPPGGTQMPWPRYVHMRGGEIAADQTDWVAGASGEGFAPRAASGAVAQEKRPGGGYAFTAGGARISFDANGMLCGYSLGGREYVKSPMRLDAMRAPSSNEVRPGQAWFASGLGTLEFAKCELSAPVRRADGSITFTARGLASPRRTERLDDYGNGSTRIVPGGKPPRSAPRFETALSWTVRPDGSVLFDSEIRPHGKPIELGRIGFALPFAPAARAEWFGAGPQDDYPDRCSGAFLERHLSSLPAPCPYARPEDYGTHGRTRAVRLAYGNGAALTFRAANAPLWFSAIPYTARELVESTHPAALPAPDKTVLVLSSAVRGLGGASCGPPPLARDIIKSNRPYRLSFMLSPLADEPMGMVKLPPAGLPPPGDYADAGWIKVTGCDSEQAEAGESAANLVDGDAATIWHSSYGRGDAQYPHFFELDLGRKTSLKGLRVTPRQDGNPNGRVRAYAVYGRDSAGGSWKLLAHGELPDTAKPSNIKFKRPAAARHVKFYALSPQPGAGADWASMAEIAPLE